MGGELLMFATARLHCCNSAAIHSAAHEVAATLQRASVLPFTFPLRLDGTSLFCVTCVGGGIPSEAPGQAILLPRVEFLPGARSANILAKAFALPNSSWTC